MLLSQLQRQHCQFGIEQMALTIREFALIADAIELVANVLAAVEGLTHADLHAFWQGLQGG